MPLYQQAGWPVQRVLTDGGSEFKAEFAAACQALGIRHTRTKPQMTDEGYVGLDVHRATRIGSAGHGGQILLSDATCLGIDARLRLPPDATVQRLGAFVLKDLPGLESIWQLTVSDLPDTFPPLRLETSAGVTG